jgi:hypothetical protein
MSWDSTAFDFGSHKVGAASPPKTFTLTATCDGPDIMVPVLCIGGGFHNFGTPAVTGDGFSLVAPNTCSAGSLTTVIYPSSSTCTSTVAFAPASLGPKTGELTLPSGPDVTLSGAGASPDTGSGGKSKKCKKKKKGKKRSAAAAKKKKCKKKKK